MKWISTFKHPEEWAFEIERDDVSGFYIYVYDSKGVNIYDYVQDSEIHAKGFVHEEFSVPRNSWKLIENQKATYGPDGKIINIKNKLQGALWQTDRSYCIN